MLVDIKNLQISFETRTSRFDAVRGFPFSSVAKNWVSLAKVVQASR